MNKKTQTKNYFLTSTNHSKMNQILSITKSSSLFLIAFLWFHCLSGQSCGSIIGNFTNGATGILDLDLNGTLNRSCSTPDNYEYLDVTGNVTLVAGNQLTITIGGTFSASDVPTNGIDLVIMNYTGTRTGTFGFTPPVVAGIASPNLVFTLKYTTPNKIILNIKDPCNPDQTPPIATVPADQTVNTNNNTCQVSNFQIPAPTGMSDACGGPVTTMVQIVNNSSGSNFMSSVGALITLDTSKNLLIYSFKDNAIPANVYKDTTIIHVKDMVLPKVGDQTNPGKCFNAAGDTIIVLSNLGDDMISGDCSATVLWSTPASSDNCPGVALNQIGGPLIGTAFTVGFTTVIYKATDVAGNSSTCSFVVHVKDNEPPTGIVCPSNATLNTAPGVCTASHSFAASGAVDNCMSVTYSYKIGATPITSPYNFPLGSSTVTATASDGTNVITCTFTVTVSDDEDPTITCPSTVVRNTDTGLCTATGVSLGTPVVSDNCGTLSPTNNGLEPYALGNTTVTWTVYDNAGNSATCTHTVTIQDNELPMITCPSNITQPNDIVNCGAVVNYTPPIGTDNCSGPSTAQIGGLASGANYPVGVTTNTFRVTDGSGNSATCSFTVSVVDTELPAIICPSNITQPNDIGNCVAVVSYTAPVGTDNCSGPTTVQTSGLASGANYPVGVTTNTFRVTDGSGNTATCSFTVTVQDTELPTITCPSNITQPTSTGICSTVVLYTAPIGTDNCSGPTTAQIAGLASGANYPLGVTTNTFRVTDGSGNSAICSFTVTVQDTELPMITCPSNITQSNDIGNCGAVVSYTAPVGSDNCGGSTTAQIAGLASGASYPVGVTTNTFRVTDGSGNTATCSFTVTVNDTELPTINCPPNVPVFTDAGQCEATGVNLGLPTGSDNCPGTIIFSNNGVEPYMLGNTSIIWTATDVNGNTSTCIQVVTVSDGEAPAIICPADLTVNTDPSLCNAVVNYLLPTVTDNCTIDAEASQLVNNALVNTSVDCPGQPISHLRYFTNTSLIPLTINEISYGIYEANISQNLTLNIYTIDPSEPFVYSNLDLVATATTSVAVGAMQSIFTQMISATIPVNKNYVLEIVEILDDDFVIGYNDAGQLQPTYVASVGCGISNPKDLDFYGLGIYGVLLYSDASAPALLTLNSGLMPGSAFSLGTTTVTYTATDIGGNTASCSFTILVEDNEVPSITCPDDVTVDTDSGLCTSSGVILGTPISSDNCTAPTFANNSIEPYSLGNTNVTWTATDGSGNTNTCVQVVVVEDNEVPSITCPADVTVDTDSGLCTSSGVTLGTPISSDNCTPPAIANNSIEPYSLGNTSVTWTATDGSGNTNTCIQIVVVEDNEVPNITCPADVTVDTDSGLCTSSGVTLGTPISSDNCTSPTTVNNSVEPYLLGNTNITWTATDGSGNTNTCVQVVTVVDNEVPIAICNTITVILSSGTPTMPGSYSLVYADVLALSNGSSDNCTIDTITSSQINFSCLNPSSTSVTVTVTDGSGNTNTCVATININPILPVGTSTTLPAVCSDLDYTITFNDYIAPDATYFSWGVNYVTSSGNYSGLNTSGTLTDNVENLTSGVINVVYTITPFNASGCPGNSFTITKPINPEPVVNDLLVVTCSDVDFPNAPVTLPTSGINVGVSSWRYASLVLESPLTLSTPPAGGPGGTSNNPSNFPFNATNNATGRNHIQNDAFRNLGQYSADAIYSIIPTGVAPSFCVGDTFTVIGTIDPEPLPIQPNSAIPIQPICSGSDFEIDLDSFIVNLGIRENDSDDDLEPVSYTWTVSSVNNSINNGAISPLLWSTFFPGLITTGTGNLTGNITNGLNFDIIISYTVTPTSTLGCQGSNFIVKARLYQNPEAVTIPNGDLTLCEGEKRILNSAVVPSGPAYTYSWTVIAGVGNFVAGTQNLQSPTLMAGSTGSLTVQLVATNAVTFCNDTATLSFTVNPSPSFDSLATEIHACASTVGGLYAIFNLDNATTDSNVTYHISESDAITGLGAIINENNYTGTHNQVIYVRKVNGFGCFAIGSFHLIVNQKPTPVILASDDEICIGSSVTLSLSGVYDTYLWDISESSAASITVALNTTTTISVVVTDENGCENSSSIHIHVNPNPIVTVSGDNTLCVGEETTLTASGASTYEWSISQTGPTLLIDPDQDSTYTVVGTDVDGCVDTATFFVAVSPAPAFVDLPLDTLSTCAGSPFDLTLITNDVVSYHISYSDAQNGVGSIINTTSYFGTQGQIIYSRLAHDDCYTIGETVLNINTMTIVTPIVANVLCHGDSTGSVSGLIFGGIGDYTSLLEGSSETFEMTSEGGFEFTDLAPDTYLLTVTDLNGCTATMQFTITQPADLILNASIANAACNGDNGAITAIVQGGVANYEYYLDYPNDGQTSPVFSAPAGNYMLIVEDGNECRDTVELTITEPTTITIGTGNSDETCVGSADGTATALPHGGTPGYTYLWSNGQSGYIATGLSAGTYTVVVTDANGCTASTEVEISVAIPGPPTVVNCPPNWTLYLQECDISYTWLAPTITNDCDVTNLSINLDGAENEGLAGGIQQANFGPGVYDIVYTDTTADPDTVACTFTVTVVDTIAPTVICPPTLTTVACFEDTIASYATYLNFIAAGGVLNDNCNAVFSSWALTSTTTVSGAPCINQDTLYRTYAMSDIYGNSSSCVQKVPIHDVITPSFVNFPIDITIDCDADQSPLNTGVPGASDNCDSGIPPSPGITHSDVSSQSPNTADVDHYNYTITRTWEVSDACGNSTSQNQVITVQDTIVPMAVCQDITINLDEDGLASIIASDINDESSDVCAPSTNLILSINISEFTCDNVGINNTVTLTVTDVVGNTNICTANVTVADTEAPIAVCLATFEVYLDSSGMASIDSNAVDNGSTDNCAIESFSVSPSTFTCSNTTTPVIVTLTIEDFYNNTAQCTTSVIVYDTIAPVALCVDSITVQLSSLLNAGSVLLNPAMIDDQSSDACGPLTLAISPSTLTCTNVGANIATLTVTDVNLNSSTCVTVVTVEDVSPPIASCLDVTISLDDDGQAAITTGDIDNESADNCGVASLALDDTSFNCTDTGSNIVVLTVTDINGNSATCTASVTIVDITSPIALCSDITISLNAAGVDTILASDLDDLSTDNCGVASFAASETIFNCLDVGENNLILTVTDVSGNSATCVAVATVLDEVPPIANCKDVTVYLDEDGTASLTPEEVDSTSTDACGIASFELSQYEFDCTDEQSSPITVILTVTDSSDNTATCQANITVIDNINPIALCQSVTINIDEEGLASTTAAAVDDGSTDACDLASMSLSSTNFTCANVGSNLVILTVTDVNGNSASCTAYVFVQDLIPATAICQNLTVLLDNMGYGSTTANDVNNGSFDNCGIDDITLSQTDFDCSDVGDVVVSLTVTDDNGNVSSCSATVSVEDNVPPVALCQAVTVSLDNTGNGSTTAALVNNGSSDACGIDELSISPSSFTCANVGSGNTVTLTVTDVNGNTATCSSTVTVVDNVPPVALCSDITISLDGNGNASIIADDIDNGSNDACGLDTTYLDDYSFTCVNVGSSNTIVLTVVDVNSNSSTCSAVVTVEDNVAPNAICQNVTIYLDQTGNASIDSNTVNNASTDACGIASFAVSDEDFTCADTGGPNIVTLTVTDVNGNSATCIATVTVLDTLDPIFVGCPASYSIVADYGFCFAAIQDTIQDISDNCTIDANLVVTVKAVLISNNFIIPGVTVIPIAGGKYEIKSNAVGLPVGLNRITVYATDQYGNKDSCVYTVQVNDILPPIITCPPNMTVNVNPTTCNAVANWNQPIVSDFCPGLSVTSNFASGSTFALGTHTVIYTATDASGNTSTCSFTVTITGTCILPIDIRPQFMATNGTYNVGQNRDHVIRIRNIGTAASTGTITFFVPNLGGYTTSFNSSQTVASLIVGSTTVQNANWTVTTLPTGKRYTSTVSIPAGGESRVAINYSAITAGASGNMSVTIGGAPNNGGDTNVTNNNAVKLLSTSF